jgi:hypothetical protein
VADARGNAVIESPWLAHLRPIVAREIERAGVFWIHVESSGSTDADWAMWSQVAEPLGLGTVHRVDTTRPVDVRTLIQDLTG